MKIESNPKCPKCKTTLGGCTAMEEGQTPREGDVSICVYCNSVLQFTEELQLEFASVEAIEEMMLEISQAQIAAKDFIKKR